MATVGERVGRFRLVRTLGAGGFGTVWEAVDDVSGASVAVKLLDQMGDTAAAVRTQLLAEAAALRAVDSPHTLRVLDVVDDGVHLALVTDLVPGVSLRTVLDEHGPLSGRDALVVLHGAASGLAAVHAAGLVHGDVKPANMLVEPSGSSRLIDFGLTSLPGWVSADSLSPWGSPAYAPPEQVAHDYRDLRSDIYSLTVSLFEVVCGRRPFVGSTVDEVRSRHVHEALPDPRLLVPDLGDRLTQLIMWGLAKDPAGRPPDVATWLHYLEAAAAEKYGVGWAAPATVGSVVGGMVAGGVIASGVLSVSGAVGAGSMLAGSAGGGALASAASASALGGVSAGGTSAVSGGGFWSTLAGKVVIGTVATGTVVGGGFAVKTVVDHDAEPPPPAAVAASTPPLTATPGEKIVLTVWDDDGDNSVVLADSDGSHQEVLASGSDGALAPDGTQVAFVTPDGEIATVATTGGPWHTVVTTDDGQLVGYPRWSADGATIRYELSFGSTAHQVLQVDATATTKAPDGDLLVDGGPGLSMPSSGPGTSSVYADVTERSTGESALFVVDASGASPRQVDVGGVVSSPAWSPQGDVIAYAAKTFDADGGFSATVRLVAPDGSGDRLAADHDFGESELRLVWSPDGEQVAVGSGNGVPRTTSILTPSDGEVRPFMDAEITDWRVIPTDSGTPGPTASATTSTPADWSSEQQFSPPIELDGSGRVIGGAPAVVASMPADLKAYFASEPGAAMGWSCAPADLTFELERYHPDGFVMGGVSCSDPAEAAWAIWSRQSGVWTAPAGGNGSYDCATLSSMLGGWSPPPAWGACD